MDKNRIYNEKNKTKKFIKINNLKNSAWGTRSGGNLSIKWSHDNHFNENYLVIIKENYGKNWWLKRNNVILDSPR